MAEFDIIGVDAVTGKMGKTSTSDTLNINLASLKDVSLTSPQTGDVLVRTENGWSSSSPESLLSSPYTTVYYDDFLYNGTPFGILPDLILEEPDAGEILFGAQSFLSINLFNSESVIQGSIKKVTGNPLNHKISCAFKHSANDANMRAILFGYNTTEPFPLIGVNRIAIIGILDGLDYRLSASIENSAGGHSQTLGIVTDTLNTLSIEFTESNIIFTLNETSVTIDNTHPDLPTFALGYPALEFRVFSYTSLPMANRVDLDYLKVEKNG